MKANDIRTTCLSRLGPALACALVLTSTGCASMRGKFKSGEKVNLMPFADQTISMLTSSIYPLAQDNSVLIREFLGPDTPGMVELDTSLAEADRIMDSMVTYSVELVKISELRGDESVRIKALADVVRTMEEPIRKKLAMNDAAFESCLDDITQREDFLAAVREVQPLIEGAGIYFGRVLSRATEEATDAVKTVDTRIDAKYAALLDFVKVYDARKQSVFEGLTRIHEFRTGRKEALTELLEGGHILDSHFFPASSGDSDSLAKAEAHLLERLQVLQALSASIEPEMDLYRRTHRELDEQYQFVLDGISVSRLKFVVWSQAHQKMSSGQKDPAEWFDIADAPGLLIKAGVKAIK